MNNLMKLILTSLLLGLVYSDLGPAIGTGYNIACPNDFGTTCDLQCPNGNYLLDGNGCPTCACATTCPLIKCRANCGEGGYVVDEKGCQTCKCLSKVECSRVMCRMYCQNGFKRDENGCEYCACNSSPQPCPQLTCENVCSNGYRKDYSGCQTCDCLDPPKQTETKCPLSQCRMFCAYGFRKNERGCEVCECDWTPVDEKIQCDERIPCPETRICNLNLKLCEKVNPEQVNWFLYDFELQTGILNDEKFLQTFKSGLIQNIAAKYGLEASQIAVSSVESTGLTSFQIMPYFRENMEVFDQKMDQIDIDLNSHEFRSLLPAVVSVVEDGNRKTPLGLGVGTWCAKFKKFTRSKLVLPAVVFLIALTVVIIGIGYLNSRRRYAKLSIRSDSKTPIYDTSYHLATTDDDRYHAVSAPDGTKYVVVDDMKSASDKSALV